MKKIIHWSKYNKWGSILTKWIQANLIVLLCILFWNFVSKTNPVIVTTFDFWWLMAAPTIGLGAAIILMKILKEW